MRARLGTYVSGMIDFFSDTSSTLIALLVASPLFLRWSERIKRQVTFEPDFFRLLRKYRDAIVAARSIELVELGSHSSTAIVDEADPTRVRKYIDAAHADTDVVLDDLEVLLCELKGLYGAHAALEAGELFRRDWSIEDFRLRADGTARSQDPDDMNMVLSDFFLGHADGKLLRGDLDYKIQELAATMRRDRSPPRRWISNIWFYLKLFDGSR